jgi:type I restriction enzyme M protein
MSPSSTMPLFVQAARQSLGLPAVPTATTWRASANAEFGGGGDAGSPLLSPTATTVGPVAKQKARISEFRVYPDIRDYLRRQGWNTNNPATDPHGEVYDQHEAANDAGLKAALGRSAPEHVVVISKSKRVYWVIEAKPRASQLAKAIAEAQEYADQINAVKKQRCAFYTGIAGGADEGYFRETYYINSAGMHERVEYDGHAITSLLPRENIDQIIKADSARLNDLVLSDAELQNTARVINDTLHAASINKDDRAAVVASILLTMAMGNMPDSSLGSVPYVQQVNLSAQALLARSQKEHFADHIALRLPKGEEARTKFVGALIKTADALRHINISAAMRSGTDVLGEFYEAFLKYGNGAKDLGIVLTPRHITRWAAQALPLSSSDIIFDPTAGTGGFLVSAFDEVRSNETDSAKFDVFRSSKIFGVEQQPKIASLAIVNMIFRGDGSTNIIDDNALKQKLQFKSNGGVRSAEFRSTDEDGNIPGATRVLMNPPFAHHALAQLEDGGLLFAVLPSPVMVKSGGPQQWRTQSLLKNNTLRAVIAFPEDLFYPVSIDTVGVFIEKGRKHLDDDEVVWALCATDGHAKVKGSRMRSNRVPDLLSTVTEDVNASIRNRSHQIKSVAGLIKKAPIDRSDELCELLPQVYLDEPKPTLASVMRDMEHATREYLAFLIRSASPATVAAALSAGSPSPKMTSKPSGFRLFSLTDLFGAEGVGIQKGSIHALNAEDFGLTPVVSSSTDHNGILGYYDLSNSYARFSSVISVASNGTPLTAFYHPYEIVPKDDVFVCHPPEKFPLETTMYVITALNSITWRFSYYRKAYMNKLSKIAVYMPVDKQGRIDHAWLQKIAESCDGWSQLRAAMPTWQPRPFASLGRRTNSQPV